MMGTGENGIIVLGTCAWSSQTAQRCRRALFNGNADGHEAAYVKVVVAGAGTGAELPGLLASLKGDIDLLIAAEARLLDESALIARCRQVLLAPFETELLHRYLDAALAQTDCDALAIELLENNIVGHSDAIRRLRRKIPTVAAYDAPVTIEGETGTGKELVARAVHYCSRRADNSFVAVNCAALNDELLLAELFGHERGAFTDAKQNRRGLVAQAQGGTLFLDEIDSLSPRAQGALLRFLQDREYRPLGSERVVQADVRVVCATNKPLWQQVRQNAFREDLFYRLRVVDLLVPPLRDRNADIEMLANHFLERLGGRYREPCKVLHSVTASWMNAYHWPGNVRELENYLHRSHVMTRGPVILATGIKGEPSSPPAPATGLGPFQEEKARAVARFERTYLERLLRHTSGNISEAARKAGKERRAFSRLVEKHRIDRKAFEKSALTE